MRRIPLCLVVPFVLACGPSGIVGIDNIRGATGPGTLTIRIEGTVTAAHDGTPLAGVPVWVWDFCWGHDCTPPARDTTDTAGNYSLSFVAASCRPPLAIIAVTHPGFLDGLVGGMVTCTEELQTIDIQLRRRST